jgi:hypothetical protein
LFLTYIMVQENSSRSKNQKIMSEQVSWFNSWMDLGLRNSFKIPNMFVNFVYSSMCRCTIWLWCIYNFLYATHGDRHNEVNHL